jgi:hypothetical protein
MSRSGARWQKLAGSAVVAVFLAVIGLPLVSKLLRFEPATPVREFRLTAERPPVPRDAAAVGAYPERFEAYFNDHFGLRPLLIRGMHLVKGRWLGVSTAANVLRGTDGWLYFTQKPVGTDYDAVRPFTADELERWGRVLDRRRQWLARQGIAYVVFIPPDKQTVYPEHLPAAMWPRARPSRLDQLAEYLRRHTGVALLDIRHELLEARKRARIYHVTDSHWNDRGAFVGYQALCAALAEKGVPVQPLPRSAFLELTEEEPGGDLAQMVAQEHVLREQVLRLVPLSPRAARQCDTAVDAPGDCPLTGAPVATERDDPALPRAVVFHDSFTWALGPMLAEHFRRAVFVWTDQFSPTLVRRERPDVVIQEMVERKLGFIVPVEGTLLGSDTGLSPLGGT